MSYTAVFFEKRLNSEFFVEAHNDIGSFKLVEVTRHEHSMRDSDSFSLVFECGNQNILGQQTHRLVSGDFEEPLFLVPIGQDEKGTRYEAVFN